MATNDLETLPVLRQWRARRHFCSCTRFTVPPRIAAVYPNRFHPWSHVGICRTSGFALPIGIWAGSLPEDGYENRSRSGRNVLPLRDGRSASAGAQQFTGGVRGAVRDANGVIPGVAVTLTNEATNIARETVTNDVGAVQLPGGHARHLHAEGRAHRLQDLREQGRPHRHAAVHHAGRRARGRRARRRSITVTGAVAAHRHVERLDRRHARPRGARVAAGARPQRLPDRRHGADGHAGRRPAVQPAAGSEQRLARLARRRRHAGQQLPARRRADHRAARPRGAQPDDRSGRRSQGPGPHLRRRDGPHRRRRVQRHGASRAPTSSTARASTRPVRCGASTRTSSSRRRASRRKRAGWPTPTTACTAAASAARSGRTARSSGPPPKAIARTRPATSSRSGRA